MAFKRVVTDEQLDHFLDLLASTGRKLESARLAGIKMRTLYNRINRFPEFKERVAEAHERYNEKIEREIERRAIEGEDEPLSYQGQLTGDSIKKKSNSLLLALAKRRIPEYRDKHTEVNVQEGGVLLVKESTQDPDEWVKKNGSQDDDTQ